MLRNQTRLYKALRAELLAVARGLLTTHQAARLTRAAITSGLVLTDYRGRHYLVPTDHV
jgi:hypothetical protein